MTGVQTCALPICPGTDGFDRKIHRDPVAVAATSQRPSPRLEGRRCGGGQSSRLPEDERGRERRVLDGAAASVGARAFHLDGADRVDDLVRGVGCLGDDLPQLIGGDVVISPPFAWQEKANESGITAEPRIEQPIDPAILAELRKIGPEFDKAYEPGGMTPSQFDTYGATVRTLRQFLQANTELEAFVREVTLPNPDL